MALTNNRSLVVAFSALSTISWLAVGEGCAVDVDDELLDRSRLAGMGGGGGGGGGSGGGGEGGAGGCEIGEDVECCEDEDCDDDNLCTIDVCEDFECVDPPDNEEPRFACEDEDPANADTSDECCEGTCYHWQTGGFSLMYPPAPAGPTEVIYDPLPPEDDPNTTVDESQPCPIATFSASLSGPGEGADADGATYTLTATAVALNAAESQSMGGNSSCNPATNVVMAAMTCEGCSYNAGTRTLTVTRTRTSDCGGGDLDFGDIEGGTGFGVPASVSISTVCCIIDDVTGELGPFGAL